MGKRYYFDATTGEMTAVEEIPRPSDKDELEQERERSERDLRHGHHPGGQYL